MQRGFKVLIISSILFVVSIIVFFIWGLSFSEIFIQNNPGISTSQITLEPLNSYNSSIYVNSTSKLLSITVDSIDNDLIILRELVIDPEGEIVSNSTFQNSYFSTIKPNSTGNYKFSVFNLDENNRASLYLFFGNLPFLNDNGEIDLSTFGGLILGAMLFIGGLISFIIGIIFYIKDRSIGKYRGFIPP